MSRSSKPKAARQPAAPVQPAAQTTPPAPTEAQTNQAADQAVVTQSTLGDGDATGAANQAPQADAAPQAPAPDVVNAPDGTPPSPDVPEAWKTGSATGHVLRVVGPAKGRWRAGRKFGPEPVEIPVAELTEDDLAKLEGDPELTVALVPAA